MFLQVKLQTGWFMINWNLDLIYCQGRIYPSLAWVKVFRFIPEFRNLRLKVSLKMLNSANNSFSDLLSVYMYLNVFDH